MKRLVHSLALVPFTIATSAMAQPVTSGESWHAKTFGEALAYSALFGLVGIIIMILGFKLFDLFITRIDLEEEIRKGNVAVAILCGAALLAIGWIITASIS
jgi:putative membrane protein